MTDMYKIHYGWRSGGASSSDITYYEDQERFVRDLVDHLVDIEMENTRRGVMYSILYACRRLRGRQDKVRTTTKLYKVQRLVNDEWQDVEYEFIKPGLVLK